MNLAEGEDQKGQPMSSGGHGGTHRKLLPSDGSLRIVEVDVGTWTKQIWDAQLEAFCRCAKHFDAVGSPDILLTPYEIEERLLKYLEALNKSRWETLLQRHKMEEANIHYAAKTMGFV